MIIDLVGIHLYRLPPLGLGEQALYNNGKRSQTCNKFATFDILYKFPNYKFSNHKFPNHKFPNYKFPNQEV